MRWWMRRISSLQRPSVFELQFQHIGFFLPSTLLPIDLYVLINFFFRFSISRLVSENANKRRKIEKIENLWKQILRIATNILLRNPKSKNVNLCSPSWCHADRILIFTTQFQEKNSRDGQTEEDFCWCSWSCCSFFASTCQPSIEFFSLSSVFKSIKSHKSIFKRRVCYAKEFWHDED